MIQSIIYVSGASILASVLVIIFFKWRFTYWTRRGKKSIPYPTTPFGHISKLMKQETSPFDLTRDFYNDFKKRNVPHGGIYFFMSPIWMPVEKDLIKNILIKDFHHFMNHGLYVNEKMDPLTGNVFFLCDEKWKRARNAFTESFTSGKVKMMFPFLMKSSKNLEDVMKTAAQSEESVDIKDYMARFSMDIIGSVAYGLDLNTLWNKNGSFNYYGRKAINLRGVQGIKQLLSFLVPPKWLSAVNFKYINSDVENFFLKLVRDTINIREENNIERNDLFDRLMKLRKDKNTSEDRIPNSGDEERHKIEINEIAAHVFFFFIAAFETTASTATFALLELSLNQDIQEKVRIEITTVLAKHGGKLTYEACDEMIYMEQIVLETLRKYPPLSSLPRICTKDYNVPNSDVVIEKDTLVMVPVVELHYDEEIYPKPEEFNPERFDNRRTTHSNIFMPFGEGPRICIGWKMGLIETKLALITLLKDHKVILDMKKTALPIKFDANQITAPQGEIWLNVQHV